jgi:chromosome segregation ATPase
MVRIPNSYVPKGFFLAQDDPVNRVLALLAAAALLAGCQSAYYAAAEKVGYAKREILVDRVESARDAQQDAREEITDALTEFRKVVDFEGGELEKRYKALDAQLKDSERAADAVRSRIAAVEDVAGALFKEWQDELGQYSSPTLRARSEEQLRQTKARYGEMIGAMKRAEARLEPALAPLRDQVLFLKHNLNAQAVAGLKGEVVRVDAEVNRLVQELDAAIAEADRFIAELEAKGGSSS